MATVDLLLRSEKGSALSYTEMDSNWTKLQNAVAPIGTIVAMANNFGAQSTMTGWLECDGSGVSQSTYADLFAEIGHQWNYLDKPISTLFYLPDLHGAFLRGRDPSPGFPDIEYRDAVTGFNREDTGSLQYSAVFNHDHWIMNSEYPNTGTNTPGAEEYMNRGWVGGSDISYQLNASATTASLGKTSTGRTNDAYQLISDFETRPINNYVTYMIKY